MSRVTQLCLLLLAAVVLVSTPSRLLLLLLLVAVVVVVVGRTDDLLTMQSVHLDFPYLNRFMFSNISRSVDNCRNEKQESCCWDDEECDNLFTASALYQQCTISVRKCSKVHVPGSSSAELRPGSQSVHRHQHSGAGALPDIGHSVNNV